jgi:transcriptional regulator with XRE-family HTH domain
MHKVKQVKKKIMKFTRIQPMAVLSLREKLRVSQQELAARIGCSLSAVQFWEAGRSSPRGYRLRRLLELCPDEDTRALFTDAPAGTSVPEPSRLIASPSGQSELERRYLDPAFLDSLPAESRALYKETVENILQLSAMKIEGNKVAAEGLHVLAETIIQLAGKAAESQRRRERKPKPSTESPPAPGDSKE